MSMPLARTSIETWCNSPANVTNRTEAIAHRIATAGIYRKIADNQVKALRFILSGSHEDMLQLESDGRLEEWCNSTMQWLYITFGKANVVAATLHADEETPHIHATVVPIVTEKGEKPNRKLRMASESTRQRKTRYGSVLMICLHPRSLRSIKPPTQSKCDHLG